MHLFHYISLHLFHHISGSYRDEVGSDLSPETGVRPVARNGSALRVIVICAALLAALGPLPAFSHPGSAARAQAAADRADFAQQHRWQQHVQAVRNAHDAAAAAAGIVAWNGTRINGFTTHGVHRAIGDT
jgi:hypothetical protein